MSIIAVVNRKGGCGKSTLAVHLAAQLSREGHAVLLADLDRNRSASSWLKLRQLDANAGLPSIQGCVIEPDKAFRRPPGVTHIVIDTPGNMQGFELARVACYADAILMPVGAGRFDREAAAASRAELSRMPRVASGRCQLAAVGMRVSTRNNATATLRRWAAEQQIPLVGMLRDSSVYTSCAERGYTVFDMPAQHVANELAQWQSVLAWLQPLVQAAARVQPAAARPFSASTPVLKPRALGSPAPSGARPLAQPSGMPAFSGRLPAAPLLPRAEPLRAPARPGWGQRLGQALLSWPLQRLLARGS